MQYVINPFTGALDAVGGSGGASAPIAAQYLVLAPHAVLTDERVFTDGVGLLGTDAGAGSTYTLDLNINELTTETTPVAGDLFPFLDVDVSTSPTGARKVTLANLATAISTALGGPFQPLDADLTALAGLATTGILVRTGAGTAATRSIVVTDSATVDFTITDGNGVAGDPTITAAVIASGITHSGLAGLTTGDAGHTQFLLLAGRAGTANNAQITTTVGGTGTIVGGPDATANLLLGASAAGATLTGSVQVRDQLDIFTGLTTTGGADVQAIRWSINATHSVGASYALALASGTLTQNVDPTGSDIVVYNNKLNISITDPAVVSIIGMIAMSNQPSYDIGTGVNVFGGAGGFHHGPNFSTTGTGTLVGDGIAFTDVTGFSVTPGFTGGAGSISDMGYTGLLVKTPGGTIASTAVARFMGVAIESMGITGSGGDDDYAFHSLGAHNFLLGANGRMKLGSNSRVLTASARLELAGTNGSLLLNRLSTANEGALTASNGMVHYETTLNQFRGRRGGSWLSFLMTGDVTSFTGFTVQEDDTNVDTAVTVLDFTEPDATLVTSSPAGEANIAMNKYALLAGRSGGQTLIGGTGTTDDLILRTTAGVGASGADMIFQVGNNGATEAMRILNSGFVGIGQTAPAMPLHVTQATVGNEVARFESVATNTDPNFRIYQARVTTTNATTTTLFSLTLTAGTAYTFTAWVIGRRTGGIAGSADDCAGYIRFATLKHTGGVAVLAAGVTTVATEEDLVGYNANITVDGANAGIVTVTGIADTNMTWHGTIIVQVLVD